jgi:adenylyl-sulfate kinase
MKIKGSHIGTIWLTGMPCSGKTTIGKKILERLEYNGVPAITLDGDDLRARFNDDLGFSPEDRKENLRRVAHLCQLMNEKGIAAISSFVSPTDEARSIVKEIVEKITWVHVDCSAEECARRDVKGMWAKAKAGEIKDFTGFSAPYNAPSNPDIVVNTEENDLDTCVNEIMKHVQDQITEQIISDFSNQSGI